MRPLVLITFIFGETACLIAGDADVVPKRFVAYSGGYWTGVNQVELEGDTLLYWRGGASAKEKAHQIKPSKEAWEQFRRELDTLDVWKWQSDYSSGLIYDATNWRLEIEYADHRLKTQGNSSEFPDPIGRPSKNPDRYRQYVKALRQLLEDWDFPW